jgi:hypothetical protein
MSSNKVAPPVVDSKELLKELMRVALDPSSTKKDLSRAWTLTKSSKVRKAIAANPNADVDVMKMSARLYLKEVLSNPSFELMELFLDDPFIKKVQATYKSPPKSGSISWSHAFKHSEKEIIIRAMLLSPNLTFDGLQYCSGSLPSAVFKRDISSPDVSKRCKALLASRFGHIKNVNGGKISAVSDFGGSSGINYRDIKLMFKFHEIGLVDKSKIDNLIYKSGVISHNYDGDFIATRYIISELIKGDTDEAAIDNATKAILVVGSDVGIKKIWEKIAKDDSSVLKVKDKILRSFVKVLVNVLDFSSSYGWKSVPYALKSISEYLHEAIIDIVIRDRFRNIKKGRLLGLNTWDYEFIYGVFESIGFINYASAYHQNNFGIWDLSSIISLNSCKREVQEFFVLNNFLGGRLLISKDTSNLVGLIDELNEKGSWDEVLYYYINLDYYKTILYSTEHLRNKAIRHYKPAVPLMPHVSVKNHLSKTGPCPNPPVTPFVQRLMSGTP